MEMLQGLNKYLKHCLIYNMCSIILSYYYYYYYYYFQIVIYSFFYIFFLCVILDSIKCPDHWCFVPTSLAAQIGCITCCVHLDLNSMFMWIHLDPLLISTIKIAESYNSYMALYFIKFKIILLYPPVRYEGLILLFLMWTRRD